MMASPRLGGYQVSQRYMYHWFIKTYPRAIFEEAPRYIALLHENDSVSGEPAALSMHDKGGLAALTVSLTATRMVGFNPLNFIVVQHARL